jgi:hypothetical protein
VNLDTIEAATGRDVVGIQVAIICTKRVLMTRKKQPYSEIREMKKMHKVHSEMGDGGERRTGELVVGEAVMRGHAEILRLCVCMNDYWTKGGKEDEEVRGKDVCIPLNALCQTPYSSAPVKTYAVGVRRLSAYQGTHCWTFAKGAHMCVCMFVFVCVCVCLCVCVCMCVLEHMCVCECTHTAW